MSDIVRSEGQHSTYAGLTVDIAEDSLDRVTKLLAGISGGVYKAVGSALTRAAAAGKTAAKQPVTREYSISQSEFLSQTRNINHFVRDTGGGLSVVFGFRGNVIPLMKFNTRVNNSGQVVTQVKRSGAAETLDRAFTAQMGGHRGIYERVGMKRFPVEELYGPATPQMMYSNEEVMDEIEDKMAETYEKRIDHEILRVLNGWGR
nr:MAG TPA: minor tail protein Z [Caudoviricetes sp.]